MVGTEEAECNHLDWLHVELLAYYCLYTQR